MPPPAPLKKKSKLSLSTKTKNKSDTFLVDDFVFSDEDQQDSQSILAETATNDKEKPRGEKEKNPEPRGEKEKNPEPNPAKKKDDQATQQALQNVQVSHAACEDLKAQMFGWQSSTLPCLGPDGMPVKTSVCDDIDESVRRASNIEQQLASAKVKFKYTLKAI